MVNNLNVIKAAEEEEDEASVSNRGQNHSEKKKKKKNSFSLMLSFCITHPHTPTRALLLDLLGFFPPASNFHLLVSCLKKKKKTSLEYTDPCPACLFAQQINF